MQEYFLCSLKLCVCVCGGRCSGRLCVLISHLFMNRHISARAPAERLVTRRNVPELGGLRFVFLGIHTFLNPSWRIRKSQLQFGFLWFGDGALWTYTCCSGTQLPTECVTIRCPAPCVLVCLSCSSVPICSVGSVVNGLTSRGSRPV